MKEKVTPNRRLRFRTVASKMSSMLWNFFFGLIFLFPVLVYNKGSSRRMFALELALILVLIEIATKSLFATSKEEMSSQLSNSLIFYSIINYQSFTLIPFLSAHFKIDQIKSRHKILQLQHSDKK
jgi:hypothetical protein